MVGRIAAIVLMVLVSAVFCVGCSSHQRGGSPEPSSDIEKDLAAIEKHYGAATAVETALTANTVKARNDLIAGRLVAMNLRYLRFVRETTADKQALDSASDIAILSLNLAGAALGDVTTKTVLAAVSAGVAGTRISIDKNFFYEKTMPALVAAMNAERRKALLPLIKGMRQPLEEYPIAQAITDLDVYYHAGTLIGAVNAVTASAGEDEKKAQEDIAGFLRGLQEDRKSQLEKIKADGGEAARVKLAAWYASIADLMPSNPPDSAKPNRLQVVLVIFDAAARTVPADRLNAVASEPARRAIIADLNSADAVRMVEEVIKLLQPDALAELFAAFRGKYPSAAEALNVE